jgi:DNA-binding Lrp family transcriptional regulator
MINLENLKAMGTYSLYTVEEISNILNIKEKTIRNWIRRGLKVHASIGSKSHILGKDLADYWERFVKKIPKKERKDQDIIDKVREHAKNILNTRDLIPKRPYREIANAFDLTDSEVEYMVKDIFPTKKKVKYKDYVNTYNVPIIQRVTLRKMKLKSPEIVKHLGVYFYSKKAIELAKSQLKSQPHMKEEQPQTQLEPQ